MLKTCVIILNLAAARKDKKIVCFYAGKSVSGSKSEDFTARDVDPNLCTHLVYPYADLDSNDNLIAADSLLEMEKGKEVLVYNLNQSSQNIFIQAE